MFKDVGTGKWFCSNGFPVYVLSISPGRRATGLQEIFCLGQCAATDFIICDLQAARATSEFILPSCGFLCACTGFVKTQALRAVVSRAVHMHVPGCDDFPRELRVADVDAAGAHRYTAHVGFAAQPCPSGDTVG